MVIAQASGTRLRWPAIPVALCLILTAQSGVAQAPMQASNALRQMLAAVQSGSYGQFIAAADSKFSAGFTRQMFERLGNQLAPKLKGGYSTTFFGKLNQGGYVVYVWRLEFKDGNDDFLVTLFIKDGKVGGFWVR